MTSSIRTGLTVLHTQPGDPRPPGSPRQRHGPAVLGTTPYGHPDTVTAAAYHRQLGEHLDREGERQADIVGRRWGPSPRRARPPPLRVYAPPAAQQHAAAR
jgi:hypothetical protein